MKPIVAITLFILILHQTLPAEVLTVPGDFSTLQEAVNESSEGDQIVLRIQETQIAKISEKTLSLLAEEPATLEVIVSDSDITLEGEIGGKLICNDSRLSLVNFSGRLDCKLNTVDFSMDHSHFHDRSEMAINNSTIYLLNSSLDVWLPGYWNKNIYLKAEGALVDSISAEEIEFSNSVARGLYGKRTVVSNSQVHSLGASDHAIIMESVIGSASSRSIWIENSFLNDGYSTDERARIWGHPDEFSTLVMVNCFATGLKLENFSRVWIDNSIVEPSGSPGSFCADGPPFYTCIVRPPQISDGVMVANCEQVHIKDSTVLGAHSKSAEVIWDLSESCFEKCDQLPGIPGNSFSGENSNVFLEDTLLIPGPRVHEDYPPGKYIGEAKMTITGSILDESLYLLLYNWTPHYAQRFGRRGDRNDDGIRDISDLAIFHPEKLQGLTVQYE